jgi:hypothetical protein
MKSLFFGLALILLIGLAGFFYRNVMESSSVPEPIACTMEAKICPDGSSVGRVGPSCAFAPCAFPNVEDTELGIGFVAPSGYKVDENAYGADPSLVAAFVKPSMSESVSNSIIIRRYPIEAGETADDVILAHTRYQPADMQAENFERFTTESIGGKTFRSTVIERFEAVVQSAYFLARAKDVLMFEVVEHDVTDWMEPTLSVKNLPEHAALREMLRTFQAGE